MEKFNAIIHSYDEYTNTVTTDKGEFPLSEVMLDEHGMDQELMDALEDENFSDSIECTVVDGVITYYEY